MIIHQSRRCAIWCSAFSMRLLMGAWHPIASCRACAAAGILSHFVPFCPKIKKSPQPLLCFGLRVFCPFVLFVPKNQREKQQLMAKNQLAGTVAGTVGRFLGLSAEE